MRVFATWSIPEELRNALLRHLRDFEAAHPGCQFEAFVQPTPTTAVAELLREPDLSVAQVLGRRGPSTLSDDGPQLSPFERAIAATFDLDQCTPRVLPVKLKERSVGNLAHVTVNHNGNCT